MQVLRPPRQLLLVFLSVAVVSAAALGSLGWMLLQQDAALEVQRRQERLDQAADRAAAAKQRSVAELQARIAASFDKDTILPDGVSAASITATSVTAWPRGSLSYLPVRETAPPSSQVFVHGERLEFVPGDLAAAARVYARLAASTTPVVRAGGLARLARVRRKTGEVEEALQAYTQLASMGLAHVGGLPASLVARVGRASVFEETHRAAELRAEADALQRDIVRGRWPLARSEYEFYSAQAATWLGTPWRSDVDALARAEAAEWLWANQTRLPSGRRRLLTLASGPALVAWQSFPDSVVAVIAGPKYLAALCAEGTSSELRCALSDAEGRTVVGHDPAARASAVRTASAAGLPWTLHVSAPDEPAGASPRRRLLILSFAVVGLVMAAGWYFIVRAMSRERRVSQLQSDFVSAVSHEFRSPVTSLAHIADMLASDRFASDDLRRQSYAVLVRDTDRLRGLVEGLLDFRRFEAGAAALRLEPLDLAALVRTVVSDFQDHVAAQGYTIELTTPAGVVSARVDREAVTRALWNLLDNAVKYSPDCRTVWVDVTAESDSVSVTVRDEGLGIPPHEQREIFDRFVRGADSTARRIKGTGIGLAMVREIVQAHGGEIHLASEPGRGSRFTMVLRTARGVA